MAAGADLLVESKTGHGTRRTGRLHALLRSGKPGLAVRRTYKYTSTDSQIFSAFARTSSGADHHRIVLIAAFGLIKNDYDDYLGTGQPLKTDDDLKASRDDICFASKETGSSAAREALPITRCSEPPLKTILCSRHSACGVSSQRAGRHADA